MMGERTVLQESLFYSFSLEGHVPQDHLLRSIDRFVDLGAIREHLRPYYSETGRPSIDPELMVRMLIVGYCMGIRSERRLCEEVHLNLAYRWFCRLGLGGCVPDHSTLSRRSKTLEVPPHRRLGAGPLHLLVDSTGLKLGGAGEWLVEKHGTSRRRSWRKLHIGIDGQSGEIVAIELTKKESDDAARTDALLDQLPDPLASFTADGAYDQDRVYETVGERHPDAAVIVPPRATAVPGPSAATDLAWSPDSGLLFALDAQGRVRLVDPVTGALATMPVALPPMTQIAVRPAPR